MNGMERLENQTDKKIEKQCKWNDIILALLCNVIEKLSSEEIRRAFSFYIYNSKYENL